jgi:hypothetical protein
MNPNVKNVQANNLKPTIFFLWTIFGPKLPDDLKKIKIKA